jgi:hypothetical protein
VERVTSALYSLTSSLVAFLKLLCKSSYELADFILSAKSTFINLPCPSTVAFA